MFCAQHDFQTEKGFSFNGVTLEQLLNMREQLFCDYGLQPSQLCEAASYSLAMVIRYALGLSATAGRVATFVDDSLTGWIALATLRHLINAGCEGFVVFLGEQSEPSCELTLQLAPLKKMGLESMHWIGSEQLDDLADVLEASHNSICGLYNPNKETSPLHSDLIDILNEIHTPIHAIEAPLGINVNTGSKEAKPLFASSTLSLGAPLKGLSSGQEYVGRHYVCDVSFPRKLYGNTTSDTTSLFCEQPVVQIFPAAEQS